MNYSFEKDDIELDFKIKIVFKIIQVILIHFRVLVLHMTPNKFSWRKLFQGETKNDY